MYCTKCGALLKENAKFCTKCGQKVAAAQAAEPAAPAPVEESTEKSDVIQLEQSDINTVNGRIFWNIQPGQIARVIDEVELNSYRNIKGIIIQEGTRAYIRSNGKTIATIAGGSYDIVAAPTSVASDVKEGISSGWNHIINLFKKDKEKKAPDLHKEQQEAILRNAKNRASFSVVILLEKAFPLLIGQKRSNPDEYKDILPMKIQAGSLNVDVIFNAYFKIADYEKFILHYLTDCKSLNTTAIVHEISDTVRMVLQDTLHDKDLSTDMVPKELYAVVKDRMADLRADGLFGLSLVRVVEISLGSKDLERFRALSAELYLSEKELDYLRRTNEFKNRLAETVNSQRLHEARTEVELQKELDQINVDNLLRQDELEKFKHVLENERLVHDARNDAERDAALNELYKSELLRKEDVEVLKMQIETNAQNRNQALQMMRLRDGIEFERVRLEGEADKAVTIARGELAKQGLYDEYADGRFYKELEKKRAEAEAALDIEQRKRDIEFNDEKRRHDVKREDRDAQFEQFMTMMRAKEEAKERERQLQAELEKEKLRKEAETEKHKWDSAHGLSAEQIWAMKGGEAAAEAYARSRYSVEAEREANERVERERMRRDEENRRNQELLAAESRRNQELMVEMMRDALAAASGTQVQRAAEKDRELKEKEERILRQEQRMDTAYDRALDYATKNNAQQREHHCPSCGSTVRYGDKFCDNCGAELS